MFSGSPSMKNSTLLILPVVLFSMVLAAPCEALDLAAFDVHSGLLWMIDEPADDETTGAPDPLLTPIGAALSFPLNERLSFDPGIYVFGLNYGFQEWDRPRPAQIEHREMYVVSLLLNPAFVFTFPWTERISWGTVLSPSLLLRIPTLTAEGEETAHSDMLSYFMGAGRFIFPEAGLFLDIGVNEKISFRPGLRFFLPVFHLWDGDPLADQSLIYFDAALRFRLSSGGDSGS